MLFALVKNAGVTDSNQHVRLAVGQAVDVGVLGMTSIS